MKQDERGERSSKSTSSPVLSPSDSIESLIKPELERKTSEIVRPVIFIYKIMEPKQIKRQNGHIETRLASNHIQGCSMESRQITKCQIFEITCFLESAISQTQHLERAVQLSSFPSLGPYGKQISNHSWSIADVVTRNCRSNLCSLERCTKSRKSALDKSLPRIITLTLRRLTTEVHKAASLVGSSARTYTNEKKTDLFRMHQLNLLCYEQKVWI